MRHTAATAMALALDVDGWGASRSSTDAAPRRECPAAALLRAQGWQSGTVSAGVPLGMVWQEVGLASGLVGRKTAGGTAAGGAR
jgi:hypothetical protein